MSAGIPLWRCRNCGSAFYPEPLLCPHCGGADGEPARVYEGLIEQATVVHRAVGAPAERPPRQLATVVLPGGQRVIAALDGRPERGGRVVLRESGGAILASRRRGVGPIE